MNLRPRLASPLLLSAALLAGSAASAAPRTIRWVVAHAKSDTSYSGLMEQLKKNIATKSKGKLQLELVDVEGNDGWRDPGAFTKAYKMVQSGAADMSQLANAPGFPGFETPGLITSYEQAEAVWNGPVGENILKSALTMSDKKVYALAFAYSGGYRVLAGLKPVRTVADLKGLRMRDDKGPMSRLKVYGVKPVAFDMKDDPASIFASGKIDLEETEINGMAYFFERFPALAKQIKYINVTRHGLLVTEVVASAKLLETLTEEQRKMLIDEVKAYAAAERKLSIELAARNVDRFRAMGINVIDLPQAEYDKMAARALAEEKTLPPVEIALRKSIRGVKPGAAAKP